MKESNDRFIRHACALIPVFMTTAALGAPKSNLFLVISIDGCISGSL